MCNSIILKLEDISSIKRYFEFILSQTEKGEKFPIKLDDVFALVYSRKDKAVRALIDSDQFMQDIDYKVFPLNGGNSNGGRPSMVYMLSVSCLEYFIARKVRSVFEVYRSVFHGCVYNEKRKLIPDFSNPAEAARAWADQYEAAQRAIAEKSQAEAEKQQALKTIEEHKPDVEFAESFRKVDHNNMWLIRDIAKKMVNVDGSKRIWKQPEIKDIFEKCGAKKPDKATWGDVQYVFAMYYSDGFPKVFKCENELVKATLMYLDDPDAPEGVAFIRWLAVQDYLGEKINWKDLT